MVRVAVALTTAVMGLFVVGSAVPASAAINPRTLTTAQVRVNGAAQDGLASGNVACPAGSKVIAAGLGHARMTGLIPRPDFNGVIASGAPQGTGADQFMVIQVTCAPNDQLAGFTQKQVMFPFSGSVLRRGVVSCPAGTYAIGGGGMMFNSRGGISASVPMVANTPTADGSGWQVTVLDAIQSDTLTVSTQCAPKDTSTLRQATFDVNTASSNEIDCGITGLSFGAGLLVVGPDGTEAQDGSLTQLTQLGTRGWFTAGTSPTAGSRLVVRIRCVEPT
ncbi:hypothetical protein GCM10027176_33420 [Actinoallomurus bryophytorum]